MKFSTEKLAKRMNGAKTQHITPLTAHALSLSKHCDLYSHDFISPILRPMELYEVVRIAVKKSCGNNTARNPCFATESTAPRREFYSPEYYELYEQVEGNKIRANKNRSAC